MGRIYNNNLDFFSDEGIRNCNNGYMKKGLEYFNRGLAYDKDNIKLLFNKACCLFEMDRIDEAETIFKRVIELCDGEEKTEDVLEFKYESFLFLKDFENAKMTVQELLEKYPNNTGALLQTAINLNKEIRYEKALEYVDRVLEIDSSDYNAILIKCEILMDMEKYDLAKKYLDKAFEMNPDFSYVWYLKGEYESKAFSDYESAFKYYDKAIQMEPKGSKYFYDAGCCLILLGRNDEAKEYFRKIFELSPEEYGSERYELLDKIFDIIGNDFAVQ